VLDDEVQIGQLTAGIPILGVPAAAARVYVFGTLPSAGFLGSITDGTTNISDCLEAVVTVENLFDNGSVLKVPAYGSALILPDGANFKADVDIYPAAGRIELTKLTGSAEIEQFDVEAVYVNNYYEELNINGAAGGSSIVNHGIVTADYAPVGSGGLYDGTPGALYDELTPITSAVNVVEFGGGDVLAYNLMPLASGTTAQFPHLVIRLNNIILAGSDASTFTGPYYLTVTGVALTSAPTEKIPFVAGNIYTITNLEFSPGDLSETPEPLDKEVTVKAIVKNWEVVPVVPVLN
jgi:hypothetical protein